MDLLDVFLSLISFYHVRSGSLLLLILNLLKFVLHDQMTLSFSKSLVESSFLLIEDPYCLMHTFFILSQQVYLVFSRYNCLVWVGATIILGR